MLCPADTHILFYLEFIEVPLHSLLSEKEQNLRHHTLSDQNQGVV